MYRIKRPRFIEREIERRGCYILLLLPVAARRNVITEQRGRRRGLNKRVTRNHIYKINKKILYHNNNTIRKKKLMLTTDFVRCINVRQVKKYTTTVIIIFLFIANNIWPHNWIIFGQNYNRFFRVLQWKKKIRKYFIEIRKKKNVKRYSRRAFDTNIMKLCIYTVYIYFFLLYIYKKKNQNWTNEEIFFPSFWIRS